MGINAVQHFIKSLLVDVRIPAFGGTPRVWISPPPSENADVPEIFIWGSRIVERRQSLPRLHANKGLRYSLFIYLLYPVPAAAEDVDSQFPMFIDSVMQLLRSVPIPANIIDPDTEDPSEITDLGEDMDVEYATPEASEDQRLIWQSCRITATMMERIQA